MEIVFALCFVCLRHCRGAGGAEGPVRALGNSLREHRGHIPRDQTPGASLASLLEQLEQSHQLHKVL